MRQGTPRIAALGRSLAVLEAVLRSKGAQSIRAIAADLGLPRATAHRQVVSLVGERYLTRLSGGWYGAGPRLLALAQLIDANEPLVAAAKPILHRLSGKLKCVVQLGTLDNEMVTYRYKTGPGADAFFTRVGLQLEAYCTGIGKVLLAHLPDAERSAYLATGPFPALTHKPSPTRSICAASLVRCVNAAGRTTTKKSRKVWCASLCRCARGAAASQGPFPHP